MPRFVIHKHHARNLHWDLRLELDNVLKSWAVPREPPADPGIRRLAIQVDDHDIDYIDFAGVIPEGRRGAGTVEIWDRGTFEVEERGENKITVLFFGDRLKGMYTLVRMKDKGDRNWLFLKRKD